MKATRRRPVKGRRHKDVLVLASSAALLSGVAFLISQYEQIIGTRVLGEFLKLVVQLLLEWIRELLN